MNIRRIIQRRIRHHGTGVDAIGDVNAVISANVNEGSSHSRVSTRSRQRIVQRSGRTKVTEERETIRGGDDDPAEDGETETDPAGEEAKSAEAPEPVTPPTTRTWRGP